VGLGQLNDSRRVNGRLAAWLVLVAALAAANYGARLSAGKPPKNALYEWSTALGSTIEFGFILTIALLISRSSPELRAWRRPTSWSRAAGTSLAVLVGVYAVGLATSPLLHPGREQGLAPDRWQQVHAAAFVANALMVCVVAPFVEETTFRGVGYGLLEQRFGGTVAIAGTAIAFGLAHGLVEGLPILIAFGLGLAWLRRRVESTIPGMILHGTFNAIALVLALTT
jgi:membrane protease YdiL (CAAX protease family)